MQIPSIEYIKTNQRLQYSSVLSQKYHEFFGFLMENYIHKFKLSQSEALYWYFYGITTHPVCKICGKPVQYKSFSLGYREYCSRSCLSKANSEKILEKYGTACTLTLPDVHKKSIHTLEQHYGKGVTHNWKAKEVLVQCKNTCIKKYGEEYTKQNKQKAKQTCKERYGNENYRNLEKSKRTFLEKYGTEHPSLSFSVVKKQNIQQKRLHTLQQHHSFNTSSIEKEFEIWLQEHNIEYKTQYKSTLYPWCCDFYFPVYDLYMEIQGTWTHGFHAFNKENEQDQLLLESWRSKNTSFYNNAIQTWTIRDVQKREMAQQKHLNYLEVFSIRLKDVIQQFSDAIKKK